MADGEEIVLRFRTESDLKAGEAAQKHLAAALATAKQGSPAYAALKVQLDSVNASLNSQSAAALKTSVELQKAITATKAAGGNTGAMQGQLNALRQQHGLQAPGVMAGVADKLGEVPGLGFFAKLATGPAAAGAGVLAGMAHSLREFAQAEEGVAKLDATMAQNGFLTERNRERYQELAAELQKTTAIADDEWIGVLTRLTQFGSNPKTVGVDVEAVKNLAGLMGGDVQSAAMAYSKALQGSFDMFSRYGIVIDEAGTKTEKLAKLQEELAQRGGGQLEASARTINGQFRNLKNSTADLFEAMGRGMSSTGNLQKVLYGLATSADWLAEKFGGVVPSVSGMTNKLGSMAKSVAAAEEATKKLAEQEKNLKKEAEDSAKALDNELAAIDRNTAGKLALVDAEKRLAEAQIDLGPGTDEEKAAKKAVLGAATEQKKEDAEIGALEAKKSKIQEQGQRRGGEAGAAGRERVQAEADLVKSKKLDEQNLPEQEMRQAIDATLGRLKDIQRRRESFGPDRLKGSEANAMEKDERDRLARQQRQLPELKERAAAARAAAGLTGSTQEIETRLAAAKKKEAQLIAERDDAAPKQAEEVKKIEEELANKRAVQKVNQKARQYEVRGKAANPEDRVTPPTPAAIRDDPRNPAEKAADAQAAAEATKARRAKQLADAGLPADYDQKKKEDEARKIAAARNSAAEQRLQTKAAQDAAKAANDLTVAMQQLADANAAAALATKTAAAASLNNRP